MSILDRFRLTGRRALVTGASRGLGRAIACALADAGADVVLVGRDAAMLEDTAQAVRNLGRDAWPLAADVSVPAQCQQMCHRALSLGPVDILVNNVGGRRHDIATVDLPLDTWREMLDLNLTSAVLCSQAIGKAMIARGQGGRVINMGSINSLVIGRGIAGRHYETAKAALLQFTRACALDWAPYRITVNAILPGGFMTDANKRWAREAPQVIDGFRANIPLGEYGEPDDLGPLAVYLASDASRYMTGAGLVIDGGYTLW